MGEGSLRGVSVSCVLSRRVLARLKFRAIRRGVWFRDLKAVERRLLDLTIAVVERVHSVRLAKLVSSIVERLLCAVEGRLSRLVRVRGRGLAVRLSRVAVGWGNESAVHWATDLGFIEYLAVAGIDASVGLGSG